MDEKRKQRPEIHAGSLVLIVVIGCLVYAINNGVRVNFGLLSTAIADSTGIDTAKVSFVVAIAQLLYGIMQPISGTLALKKSSSFVDYVCSLQYEA